MRPLALIFAVGGNDAIGRGGALPWEFPEDTEHFDATTRGHVVIMGRRTWDEIKVELPGRTNFVVTSDGKPRRGAMVVPSLAVALLYAYHVDAMPFVIGGAQLLHAALPLATRVYRTLVPVAPSDADTFFAFAPTGFLRTEEKRTPSGLVFETWDRVDTSS